MKKGILRLTGIIFFALVMTVSLKSAMVVKAASNVVGEDGYWTNTEGGNHESYSTEAEYYWAVYSSDSTTGLGRKLVIEPKDGNTIIKDIEPAFYEYREFNNYVTVVPEGHRIHRLVIESGITKIGEYAFGGMRELNYVIIPNSVTYIATNAFKNSAADLTIYGSNGSYAQTYAKNNNINFQVLGNNPSIEEPQPPAKPGTPAITSVGNNGDLVNVKWSKADGANGYELYRFSNGIWQRIAETSLNFYDDNGMPTNVTYKYKVRAYAKNNVGTTYGDYSDEKNNIYKTATPTSNLTIARDGNGFKLTWNKVSGMDSYVIYRKAGSNSFTALTTINGEDTVTYTDYSLTSGTTYQYYVKTKVGTSESSASKTVSANYIAPTTVSSISNGNGSVKLSWNSVSGATGYQVYRSVSGGSYSAYGDVITTTSFTDKDVKSGDVYKYYLVAKWNTTGSNASNVVATRYIAAPTGLKVVNTGWRQAKISFSASTGATGYRVFRRSNGGAWSQIGTTQTVNYVDNGLTVGTKYEYYVAAVYEAAGSTYVSANSSVVTYYSVDPATITAVNNENGKVRVKWTKVDGATGYNVYRNNVLVKSGITAVEYVDTDVKSGTAYKYCVRAVSNGCESINSNEFSIIYLTAPTGLKTTVGNRKLILNWSSVLGATGYKVYRNGAEVASVTGTIYTDSSVSNGTEYTYCVVATKDTYTSSKSVDIKAGYIDPTTVTIELLEAGRVKVSRNDVDKATGYRVLYRLAGGETAWSEDKVDSDGISNIIAMSGIKYEYCIEVLFGNYCSVKSNIESIIGTEPKNGFLFYNGKWCYFDNDIVDTEHTGFEENADGIWYVKKGYVDTEYTGMLKNGAEWWYIKAGKFASDYTGMLKNGNEWWYIKAGKFDTSYNGMLKNGTEWWYIKAGKFASDYTGMLKNGTEWWYIKAGKFASDYTGMLKNGTEWWYIKAGKLASDYTGMLKNGTEWWYIKAGKFDRTYTGMAKNANGWWYMTKGKLDRTYTGMAKNANGWWYMTKGKLDKTYTGMAKNANGWWYMKNGKLDKTYTGMAKNANGWWYMKNGKLDRTYTGMAKNASGWWYMKNGKLDKTYTGFARYNKCLWYMKCGKLASTYTGVVKNSAGWWYVTKGMLNTKFNGYATVKGIRFTFRNGKAISYRKV